MKGIVVSLAGFLALFVIIWLMHKPFDVHSSNCRALAAAHRVFEWLLVAWGVALLAHFALLFFYKGGAKEVTLEAKPQGKVAIVYYSQSKVANTALVAKWIQNSVGGELFPIEPVEPYPDAYGETLKEAQKDMANGGTRPIKPIPSLDDYDVVFIGSPIWYGTYAPPMAEFFKTHDFAGKTVAPFCTHGGGGAGRFFADVGRNCPDAAVMEGLAIRGSNQIERRLGIGASAHHSNNDVIIWLNLIFEAKQ